MRSFTFSPCFAARAPLLGALAVALLAMSCAGMAQPTRLADATYLLECESTLSRCLAPMEQACSAHGYDVLEGSEHRARYGPEALQTNVVRAQAKARCRGSDPAFGSQPSPPPTADAQATPAAVPRAGCVPGASQSCTGLGACSGAQVCAPDGQSYRPCDCSPAPGTTAPGTTTPGTTTPGTTAPGTTAPGTTAPGTTAPGTTTPGAATPGTATPGTATPGTATPGTATPGTATSGAAGCSGAAGVRLMPG